MQRSAQVNARSDDPARYRCDDDNSNIPENPAQDLEVKNRFAMRKGALCIVQCFFTAVILYYRKEYTAFVSFQLRLLYDPGLLFVFTQLYK